MKYLKAFVAASLFIASQSAMAIPYYSGTYELSDAGNGTRGIWTPIGRFTTDYGSFTVNGTNAVLTGKVTSATYGSLSFTVNMTHHCSSTVSNAGGRYVNVDNAADCNLGKQKTGGAVKGVHVDGNSWDFWSWTTSVLVGSGGLSGMTIDISQAPANNTKPFRVGIGADWDDKYLLGASGWIGIDKITCAVGQPCQSSGFNPRSADFNFRFTAVPEPTSIAMLGLGLLGLGMARRRRS